jgi:glycine/D-amino acid oxidase-like deaminating enzyme
MGQKPARLSALMKTRAATAVFWQLDRVVAPLEGSIDVDVLVVGGGYTGLSAARCLKEASPGLRVAVIERELVVYGASGRNSGYLTSLIGHDLKSLLARFGVERGRALAGVGARAVDYVAEAATAPLLRGRPPARGGERRLRDAGADDRSVVAGAARAEDRVEVGGGDRGDAQ